MSITFCDSLALYKHHINQILLRRLTLPSYRTTNQNFEVCDCDKVSKFIQYDGISPLVQNIDMRKVRFSIEEYVL